MATPPTGPRNPGRPIPVQPQRFIPRGGGHRGNFHHRGGGATAGGGPYPNQHQHHGVRPPYHQRPPLSNHSSGTSTSTTIARPFTPQEKGKSRATGTPPIHQPTPTAPSYKPLANLSTTEQSVRNDFSIHYSVTEEYPANWIKGIDHEKREVSKEYPKLRRLMDLKEEMVERFSCPPIWLAYDGFSHSSPSTQRPPSSSSIPLAGPSTLQSPPLSSPYISLPPLLAPHQFTSILITPPPHLTWQEISQLPIRQISSDPAFVFLWVGEACTDGLERGREIIQKWGFRRCEEILWVKTNKDKNRKTQQSPPARNYPDHSTPTNLLVNMKEHCLVGIRGTVRRSTDPWFIHANVDTDVMVWEGPDPEDPDPPAFPPQLYTIIENFCLGTRRLELFVPRRKVRRGWVGVGSPEEAGSGPEGGTVTTGVDIEKKGSSTTGSASGIVQKLEDMVDGADGGDVVLQEKKSVAVEDWDKDRYAGYLEGLRDEMGRYVLPWSNEIDSLRPKSPPRPGGERPNTSGVKGQAPGIGQGHHRPFFGGGNSSNSPNINSNANTNNNGHNQFGNHGMNSNSSQMNNNQFNSNQNIMGGMNMPGFNNDFNAMGGFGNGIGMGGMMMMPQGMFNPLGYQQQGQGQEQFGQYGQLGSGMGNQSNNNQQFQQMNNTLLQQQMQQNMLLAQMQMMNGGYMGNGFGGMMNGMGVGGNGGMMMPGIGMGMQGANGYPSSSQASTPGQGSGGYLGGMLPEEAEDRGGR